MPKVSVIVPAYNQSRYVEAAVRSALTQTCDDLEVVVVDDGSTDDTSSVVQAIADPRLRYVYQENRGLSGARNTGIRHARGEFLTFLDADDLFLPDKLEVLLAAFARRPELGLVAGQAILVDQDGRRIGEIFDRPLPDDPSDLLLGNPLHVGSVLLRKSWQARIGYFDEALRSYEDWDYWLRLALAGCRMAYEARPVSLYRFHQAQMTRLADQMTTASFAVLEKTYAAEALPTRWAARKDEAYSRAYLRAAAQAYTVQDFARARDSMRRAAALNPQLLANRSEPLARLVAGWANHAKTREPLVYLKSIYDNLPDELGALRRRRRREIARQAQQMAWEARQGGDPARASRLAREAFGYWPLVAFDRAWLALALRRPQKITLPRERRADN
jgi:glycosyltransferase involved in cell wall biosynthesis